MIGSQQLNFDRALPRRIAATRFIPPGIKIKRACHSSPQDQAAGSGRAVVLRELAGIDAKLGKDDFAESFIATLRITVAQIDQEVRIGMINHTGDPSSS